MAYTKENKLRRIIDVQNHFKKCYRPGMNIEWIFYNEIYPVFKISRRSFYKWLKIPAENELNQLLDDKQNKTSFKQIAMDFDSNDVKKNDGNSTG